MPSTPPPYPLPRSRLPQVGANELIVFEERGCPTNQSVVFVAGPDFTGAVCGTGFDEAGMPLKRDADTAAGLHTTAAAAAAAAAGPHSVPMHHEAPAPGSAPHLADCPAPYVNQPVTLQPCAIAPNTSYQWTWNYTVQVRRPWGGYASGRSVQPRRPPPASCRRPRLASSR